MEHDKAVAALESLPEVERMAAYLRTIWPNNKIIVTDGGVRLKVIAGGE